LDRGEDKSVSLLLSRISSNLLGKAADQDRKRTSANYLVSDTSEQDPGGAPAVRLQGNQVGTDLCGFAQNCRGRLLGNQDSCLHQGTARTQTLSDGTQVILGLLAILFVDLP
jgi:hypothetical protein